MEFFQKTLDPIIALAAIAVLDIFLFLTVGAWTVGGGETMMTGLAAKFVMGDAINRIPFWKLAFPPDPYYWKIYISLGMVFGAFVGAMLSKEFYWR
ncbi:MAG: YeeE/YedE thiosulfate transporter family protein, partial [Casimicrobiaceae bacterium]